MTPQQTAAQDKEDERRIEKVQGAENLVTEADGVAGQPPNDELDALSWNPTEAEADAYLRGQGIIKKCEVCGQDATLTNEFVTHLMARHSALAAERDMLLHTLETRAEREMEMLEGVARENDALKAERDALKALVSDPQRWRRWCDSRVLEENEALKAAALKESDLKLLTAIWEHFDDISDGALDRSHAALMANRFSDPLQRLIKKLG